MKIEPVNKITYNFSTQTIKQESFQFKKKDVQFKQHQQSHTNSFSCSAIKWYA